MFELIPGRLTINNPVMAASGTFGYGTEYSKKQDPSDIGAVVCKGITVDPREGNPPPRIIETPAGALNSIGLANIGMEEAIRRMAPIWANLPVPIIVNINGETVDEYVELANAFDSVPGVAAIELNIACPNVKDGGMLFGMDPKAASGVTEAVRKATKLPLIVKLTPNTTQAVAVAKAVAEAGAEGVTVANTYLGMAFDRGLRKPALANVTGGLSGPAIKPLTIRLVYEVSKAISIPVIGCGGIMSGEDAEEYLIAGAKAVQVATAILVDPFAVGRIARELRELRRGRD